MTFEVGKKYQFKDTMTKRVYTVLALGETRAFVSWTDPSSKIQSGEITIQLVQSHLYSEYKEPRSYSRWNVIYEDKDGRILSIGCSTKEVADAYVMSGRNKKLDVVEFKWTEKI